MTETKKTLDEQERSRLYHRYISDKFISSQLRAISDLYAMSIPIRVRYSAENWEVVYNVKVDMLAKALKSSIASYVQNYYKDLFEEQ
jgi:hypothetical protein